MAETDKVTEGGAGTDSTGTPVLRRKAARRVAAAPAAVGADAGRAVRQALSRAVQAVPGLDLVVDGLSDDRRTLAELLELLPERALLAVIEGPAEGLGIVALSQPALAAIVEMQTMGRLASQSRPPRRPTRTDAAMCAGLVDRLLSGLETLLSDAPDLTWAGGFRYASFLDGPRPLGLLLEDIAFRVFKASVTLGGTREGEVLLVLPAQGRGPGPVSAPETEVPDPGGREAAAVARAAFAAALSEAVMGAEAQLTGVLHRVRLPLGAVLALQPGDLLPVPDTALDQIELRAVDGRRVGCGRLGQNRGLRAVRLRSLSSQSGGVAEAEGAGMQGMAIPPPGAGNEGGMGGLGDLPMAAPMDLDLPNDLSIGLSPLPFDEDEDSLPPLPMARSGGG